MTRKMVLALTLCPLGFTASACTDAPSQTTTAADGHSSTSAMREAVTNLLETATTTTISPEESEALRSFEELWRWYGEPRDGNARESADFGQLIARADLIVVGRVVDVVLSRSTQIPGHLDVRSQSLTYRINVERSTGSRTPVMIELRGHLDVTSPGLDTAGRRRELPGRDAGWDAAATESLVGETRLVAGNQTLLFLSFADDGSYALYNSESVIVNDAGRARQVVVGSVGGRQPVGHEIEGVPFDEIVARVFHGAE
jgi:hypothetical protein